MVQNFFRKSLDAFVSRQTNIFSAAFFIIFTTILSQVLGLLKRRLLVSYFGASNEAGIFLAAFSIPDFIFLVAIGGALSSSFIPIFSEYISKNRKEEAFTFASSLITISMGVFALISVVVILFANQLAFLITPRSSPHDLLLMASFIRIIQLTQLFFVLGTILTAILQSFQHFLIPGIASALYNLGIIIGLVLFSPFFGIYGAVIGVLLGSVFFCAAQIPLLKKVEFIYVFTLSLRQDLKRFFYLMIPTSLTIMASQGGNLINVFFANYVSPRSYLIFEFAQTLAIAPVLLFGQSIAQASFPSLALKKDERQEFLSIFISSFNQILYLVLPISAILIVLRIPLVRFAYGAQKLDWPATVEIGHTLAFFSLSAFAQSLIYLLSRAFYAYKNTRTPFVITLFSVILNVTLAYYFIVVRGSGVYALALANSISYIVSILLMVALLDARLHLPKLLMLTSLLKILLASVVMGFALYIPIKLLDQLVFDTTRTINLIILSGIASVAGLTAYIFFTWLLDIHEAYYIIKVIQNMSGKHVAVNRMLKQVGELIGGSKQNA